MKVRPKSVQAAIDRANHYFKNSPDKRKEARDMLKSFLTSWLISINSYHGFNYLYWLKDGYEQWEQAGKPGFPEKNKYLYGPSGDETRVQIN